MLKGLLVVFGCLLIGEVVKEALSLPVPAPVFGMIIFFAGLLLFKGADNDVSVVCQGLISHLTLMFLPSSVGIFFLASRFDDQWPAIIGACVLGTLLTQVVLAVLLKALLKPRSEVADV
ncbi:holin-like protein [Sinobacterium caligoides]|uniref:Holin-like protein n=1 Tax=Sinobacterium caligoides TaxID=933926 RepID=A0A3N2DQ60_9GAMM|nr:CidA/LrgA family protein [Sinobacterium caligoides]ROS01971.1 holin-like protein [Sinobacterium caligoides]